MAGYLLKIAEKRIETRDVVSLLFDIPQDLKHAFAYRPAQFLTISNSDGDAVNAARQYSLSSTPGVHERLRITVKKINGGRLSTWLVEHAEVGDLIDVQVPRGVFFKDLPGPSHVVLLAAGSGIAPILPIGRWLLASNGGHRVTLVYANKTPDTVILADEVAGLAAEYSQQCVVEQVMSQVDGSWHGAVGRIDRQYIHARFPVWAAWSGDLPMIFYLCGPSGFMDTVHNAVQECGVDAQSINRESFDLILNDDSHEPGLEVCAVDTVAEEGKTTRIVAIVDDKEFEADWQDGEDILSALLRVDADVPFSCQEGSCASCISKLIEGRVEVRPGVLQTLRQQDLDEGLVLACLSRPKSKFICIDFDNI